MLISYKTLIFRGIHAQTIREDPSYVRMYVSMYRTPYPCLQWSHGSSSNTPRKAADGLRRYRLALLRFSVME